MWTNCPEVSSWDTNLTGSETKSGSRRGLMERRMLFERLPTEVQLQKLHSTGAIHVLAVCQYHIHHSPVHHRCASKPLTPLLIYSLHFEVHPVSPWILFIAKISDLAPSPICESPLPFSPLSVCFFEEDLPFSLKFDSFLSALPPSLSLLYSCRHSITCFFFSGAGEISSRHRRCCHSLCVCVGQNRKQQMWFDDAVLRNFNTRRSVNNCMKKSSVRSVYFQTLRHTQRLSIFVKACATFAAFAIRLGDNLLILYSFRCFGFFIELAKSSHKGKKLSVTMNEKSSELLLLSINHEAINMWIKGKSPFDRNITDSRSSKCKTNPPPTSM